MWLNWPGLTFLCLFYKKKILCKFAVFQKVHLLCCRSQKYPQFKFFLYFLFADFNYQLYMRLTIQQKFYIKLNYKYIFMFFMLILRQVRLHLFLRDSTHRDSALHGLEKGKIYPLRYFLFVIWGSVKISESSQTLKQQVNFMFFFTTLH